MIDTKGEIGGFQAGVAIVALLILVAVLLLPVPVQKVVFLDIGQGDATLVQDGFRQVLIDGGPGQTLLTRLSEEMPWFDRRIEVVIATHPDKDHIEGLVPLLERYEVGLVVLSFVPHTSQLQEAWLQHVIQEMQAHGTQVRFGWAGEGLRMGEAQFQVVWPTIGYEGDPKTTNNSSVVMRLDFGNTSFLLTGDIEAPVERQLASSVSSTVLDVDVLKAAHHGSKTSSTQEFLTATAPSVVVISVGRKNSYGHPHPDVLARLQGVKVVRTDISGSVRFIKRAEKWLLSCSAAACLSDGQ